MLLIRQYTPHRPTHPHTPHNPKSKTEEKSCSMGIFLLIISLKFTLGLSQYGCLTKYSRPYVHFDDPEHPSGGK